MMMMRTRMILMTGYRLSDPSFFVYYNGTLLSPESTFFETVIVKTNNEFFVNSMLLQPNKSYNQIKNYVSNTKSSEEEDEDESVCEVLGLVLGLDLDEFFASGVE